MGERVELLEGNLGVVVCSIDTNEYSAAYRQDHWAYLGAGIVVLSEAAGLIHSIAPETSMRLLSKQDGALDPQ
ncbi:MAG TPA: hypothetical protein VFR21_07465 [Bradyrhizobium sp.]|jgi:hypothetical protein|nr:hypothetical protein [Bradyrhizobium sp.]